MCDNHAEVRRMMESDVYAHRGHPHSQKFMIRNAVFMGFTRD